jgi:hypothetical protein
VPSEEIVLLRKIEKQSDNRKASIVSFLNSAHVNNTIDVEPPKPTLLKEAARTARGPFDEPVQVLATLTGYWGKQIAFKDNVTLLLEAYRRLCTIRMGYGTYSPRGP